MMSIAAGVAPPWPSMGSSDEALVEGCLAAREEAWSGLIEKYKRLIFSVPLKVGLSREEACDVFLNVCARLAKELPKLRNATSLTQWLIQVATYESFRAGRGAARSFEQSQATLINEVSADTGKHPDQIIRQAEREQLLREAIANLRPPCQRMMSMLFFEEPIRSYEQIAEELGIVEVSTGFIRRRCLQDLREQVGRAWNR